MFCGQVAIVAKKTLKSSCLGSNLSGLSLGSKKSKTGYSSGSKNSNSSGSQNFSASEEDAKSETSSAKSEAAA